MVSALALSALAQSFASLMSGWVIHVRVGQRFNTRILREQHLERLQCTRDGGYLDDQVIMYGLNALKERAGGEADRCGIIDRYVHVIGVCPWLLLTVCFQSSFYTRLMRTGHEYPQDVKNKYDEKARISKDHPDLSGNNAHRFVIPVHDVYLKHWYASQSLHCMHALVHERICEADCGLLFTLWRLG